MTVARTEISAALPNRLAGIGLDATRLLFADAQALVLDKPAGLPVDAPRRGGPSLAAALPELRLGFARPPAIMHRLDQDTSGCLLLARTPRARAQFQQAFESGRVGKTYWALVAANPGDMGEGGLVDLSLAKHSSAADGWRIVPDPAGKPARTRWRRLAQAGDVALIEMVPETGRTHQLRVHALHGIGRPIIGDPVYGTADPRGMMLHARRLVVPRAPYAPIDVTAPLPARFGVWHVPA